MVSLAAFRLQLRLHLRLIVGLVLLHLLDRCKPRHDRGLRRTLTVAQGADFLGQIGLGLPDRADVRGSNACIECKPDQRDEKRDQGSDKGIDEAHRMSAWRYFFVIDLVG